MSDERICGSTPEQRNAEAQELLKMLDDSDEMLAPNELKFVTDLRERFERYGPKTLISPKQVFWLRDIKENRI